MWWAALASLGVGLLNSQAENEQGMEYLKTAKANAAILRDKARQTREKAEMDAKLAREQGIKQLGSMRASYAASGVSLDGSALSVLAESARNVKRDELTIKFQGEMDARALELDARSTFDEGYNQRKASSYRASAQLMNSGTTAMKYLEDA